MAPEVLPLSEGDAARLKRWLADNGAQLLAVIGRGSYLVVIFSNRAGVAGAAEHPDFPEAVRMAQFNYDLEIFGEARRTARVVGRA